MRSFSVGATVLALVSAVAAQDAAAYATGLLAALNSFNLTTLAAVATANADALLPLLMEGNHTVFAPTDAAFAAVDAAVLANDALVAQIVTYHIFNGNFPASALSENPTIAVSALSTSPLVNLPGNAPQVAVLLAAADAQVTVDQTLSNVTSVGSATYENLLVYIIPAVLTLPGSVTETAVAAGLSSLVTALTTFAPDVTAALDTTRGLTVFAPLNGAFDAAADVIATLNESTIATVLANHVINGTVVYSTAIEDGAEATSASGQPLTFITNSTGVFVQSANIVARVVLANVLVNNGVVHVIDTILANTASNPGAAESAVPTAVPTGTATGTMPSQTVSTGGAGKLAVGGAAVLAMAVAIVA